jgi:hypothetical protein
MMDRRPFLDWASVEPFARAWEFEAAIFLIELVAFSAATPLGHRPPSTTGAAPRPVAWQLGLLDLGFAAPLLLSSGVVVALPSAWWWSLFCATQALLWLVDITMHRATPLGALVACTLAVAGGRAAAAAVVAAALWRWGSAHTHGQAQGAAAVLLVALSPTVARGNWPWADAVDPSAPGALPWHWAGPLLRAVAAEVCILNAAYRAGWTSARAPSAQSDAEGAPPVADKAEAGGPVDEADDPHFWLILAAYLLGLEVHRATTWVAALDRRGFLDADPPCFSGCWWSTSSRVPRHGFTFAAGAHYRGDGLIYLPLSMAGHRAVEATWLGAVWCYVLSLQPPLCVGVEARECTLDARTLLLGSVVIPLPRWARSHFGSYALEERGCMRVGTGDLATTHIPRSVRHVFVTTATIRRRVLRGCLVYALLY